MPRKKTPIVAQRGMPYAPTIQDKFEEFIRDNPHFYDEFVLVARRIVSARAAMNRETKYLSADGIIHFIRIYSIIYIRSNTEYRINDHISSRIVRMLKADPNTKDLHDLFRERELTAA